MMDYTESALVQQTTADYLAQLGWQSIYAYNNEDFGPGSLLGRASERDVVLVRILRKKLIELNPSLPDSSWMMLCDRSSDNSPPKSWRDSFWDHPTLPSPCYEAVVA